MHVEICYISFYGALWCYMMYKYVTNWYVYAIEQKLSVLVYTLLILISFLIHPL